MDAREAQDLGLFQLTTWSWKTSKIKSQYGEVTIAEWLRMEQKRITSDPERVALVVENKGGGYLALFVNPWNGKEGKFERVELPTEDRKVA